ncbi:unnamed protein product [Citrullus colocynthis]|uniref:Uncharacterized protein n=1 Tax=Citrullus colocynthis TaxID=252529 RepID=A0ABP0YN59_9ROSI
MIEMKVDVPMLSFFLVVLLVATTFEPISSLPSTIPAFLWSPGHRHGFSNNILQKYCTRKEVEQHVDLAIVFVGSELQSDFMLSRHVDPNLMDLLKAASSRSNFSMAFPYVAAPERGPIENLLISEFKNSCGHDLRIDNSAFEDESFQ